MLRKCSFKNCFAVVNVSIDCVCLTVCDGHDLGEVGGLLVGETAPSLVREELREQTGLKHCYIQ